MKITRQGVTYSIEKKLYAQLQKLTVELMKKNDNNKIVIICGDTGVGKTAFANQIASVCDPNFTLKNIAFTVDQAIDTIKTLHNQAINFDEAFRGVSGRSVLDKKQKALLQILYEVRQLNQVIFLTTPSFFRLDEAIAVELADVLFYIYKGKTGRRHYKMFNNIKKNDLYYKAKKGRKDYFQVYTPFRGVMSSSTYVVPEKEYRDKKFQSLFDKAKKVDYIAEKKEAAVLAALILVAGSQRKAVEAVKKFGIAYPRTTMNEKVSKYPAIHDILRADGS